MKIAFRCDTSVRIGTGHFSRCYQLAKVLKQRGHHIIFYSYELPTHYKELLGKDQIQISELNSLETPENHIPYIKNSLESNQVDYLIVDSYEIDKIWESKIRTQRLKILVIDDLHNRLHDCDYLLDQNILSTENPYENLTSENTKFLLGPKFSLINPKFTLNGHKKVFASPLRVVVFFGGADHVGATLKYMDSFKIMAQQHPVTIVTGVANPSLRELKSEIEGTSITLAVQLPDLYDALLGGDVFIGAGGVVTWERCAMGVPSLIISIAQNQEDIASSLFNLKVHDYLGSYESVTNQALLMRFNQLISSPERLREFSNNSVRIVPQSGINSVVEALGF